MKNNKVGIYTIQSFNYGNRLQNYALQEILRKQGYQVFSILNSADASSIKTQIKGIIKRHFSQDRRSNFYRFNKMIEYSSHYIGENSISIDSEFYYAIIAGSDQIWNTNFNFVTKNAFLPFKHPRKISYAASFGTDGITLDNNAIKCIEDFKRLSVREEAGKKIIESYTKKHAEVVVDPTLLLTDNEWRKVSKKPKKAKEGYILTYFLSPKCFEAQKTLERIKGDSEVYELLDPNDSVAGSAGPAEFLWLFDHADMILTDSFHACVFSFLFNKPFNVYDRNWKEGNMNSRLETFLSKFHLERKYANSRLENNIWEHEYSEGYAILEEERNNAIDFLKKALVE